jgi:hypothetical protein
MNSFPFKIMILLGLVSVTPGCSSSDTPAPTKTEPTEQPKPDTTPPTFSGIEAAVPSPDGTILVSWQAATDDKSEPGQIAYEVFVANENEAIDYTKPYITATPGSTSWGITTLDTEKTYQFAVRAVDTVGNKDSNTKVISATTKDEIPPVFAGADKVEALGSRSIRVSWLPGSDPGRVDPPMKYRVYIATTSGMQDFTGTPAVETAVNATSVVIEPLVPETSYYVVVRAVDPAGNTDTNTVEKPVKTAEGLPPTFAGATQAVAKETSIRLRWQVASDNQSTPAQISYRIYQAKGTEAYDFTKATYTAQPNTIEFLANNLDPQTQYRYIVRAVDYAGNEDLNNVEVSATTGPDIVAPTFAGATTATAESPSTIRISWAAGTDETTEAEQLVYNVYMASTSAAQDFTTPTATSAPGATSFLMAGLTPSTSYFFVVRARDQAGNMDSSTAEAFTATTANMGDTTAPTWVGPLTLNSIPGQPRDLLADWIAATDDTSQAAGIRYHFCAETDPELCKGNAFFTHIRATTAPGAAQAFVPLLKSNTAHEVYVRAEDADGNFDATDQNASGTTSPSFKYDVLPVWEEKCNACHTFSYTNTVNIPSTYQAPMGMALMKLIDPTSVSQSYLVRKVLPMGQTTNPFTPSSPNEYTGEIMPPGGATQITKAQADALKDWISFGAFNN